MRVLIIPEDFRKDQYILKPLFSRLLGSIGASSVRVEVCRDHLMGGVGEALKSERLTEVVEQHRGMTDIFILCVDRDGEVGRRQRLDQLETEFGPPCLPRTPGRRLRLGRWPGWTCQAVGDGQTFALKWK